MTPETAGRRRASTARSPRPKRSGQALPRGAVATLLAAQAEAVSRAAAAVQSGGTPEEVHALRGALRRVQATVGLLSQCLPAGDVAALMTEIRWLTRKLGPLRDLDVLGERLEANCSFHNEARRDDVLLGLASLARNAAFDKIRRRLRSARALFLIEGLGRYARDAAPVAVASLTAKDVLATLARLDGAIRKAGRGIERLDGTTRHGLRKQIKALRYDCEALSPLVPGLADYAPLLSDLHKVLGDLNDDEACRRLSKALAKNVALSGDGPWLRADDESRASLKSAWRRLKAGRGPWRPSKSARRAGAPPPRADAV